jgi:hypothetical protein
MSESTTEAAFEQCADELNEFVASLGHYSNSVLAFALRVQLSAMLQDLMSVGLWSRTRVAAFLEELRQETLDADELDQDGYGTRGS